MWKTPLSRVWLLTRNITYRNRAILPAIIAVALYCILAVLAYWPRSPVDSGAIPGATTADPVQAIWYLEWVPFALFHGHNPFITNFIDYPSGVNLATNTLASALGLAASPLTLILGPVATYSFLLRLALAASATSMCFVLRSWTRWWPAVFAGGLLYGFGSYMSDQGQWHLSLAFVPIPPLIFWCLNELLVVRQRSPRRIGILLGPTVCRAVLDPCRGPGRLPADRRSRRACASNRTSPRGERPGAPDIPALGWAAAASRSSALIRSSLLLAGPQHITGPISPVWLISQEHADLLSPIRRNIVVHLSDREWQRLHVTRRTAYFRQLILTIWAFRLPR